MSPISVILKVAFLSLKTSGNQRLKRGTERSTENNPHHSGSLIAALTHAEIRYQEPFAALVKQDTPSCCSRKSKIK